MGSTIDRTRFDDNDHRSFSQRLRDSLLVLEQLISDPDFGSGDTSFGAELELYIIDEAGRPLLLNEAIQSAMDDPQLTLELNRYNLEYNLSPVPVKADCFHTIAAEAIEALRAVDDTARRWQGTAAAIGILPTLKPTDAGYAAMTKTPRYETLTRTLKAMRSGPFRINIMGEDPLQIDMEDVTLEGANTSFQIHLKVPPAQFADTYNALQLATPLALAVSGNSPILFGHRLWQETRIPLFKQSIDSRQRDPRFPQPARVNYGHGWVRRSALELFAEAVLLYPPVLPLVSDEEPLAALRSGAVPHLNELRLHQGSIWRWNRPIYDPADGGHLRIEMRALPAGPTIVDMLANAVLMIGLTKVLQADIAALLPAVPFDYCARNFYRAAEKGLDAELMWPSRNQHQPEYHPARDILRRLMPYLPGALEAAGFQRNDFSPYLDVIAERLENEQTGSKWQLAKLQELEQDQPRSQALVEMVRQYQIYSHRNIPVARWN